MWAERKISWNAPANAARAGSSTCPPTRFTAPLAIPENSPKDTPLAPNSPYSASKAGADMMARAYFETYGFPVLVTRCSNNYGPYQFPEKLIPLMFLNAKANKSLPV